MCLKCESSSSRFQPGEGPSRGLLRDYEALCGPSFQAPVPARWWRWTWEKSGIRRGGETPGLVSKSCGKFHISDDMYYEFHERADS